jgi:hypothetical protein
VDQIDIDALLRIIRELRELIAQLQGQLMQRRLASAHARLRRTAPAPPADEAPA